MNKAYRVVRIDSAPQFCSRQDQPDPTPSPAKGNIHNRHSLRRGKAAFYGLAASLRRASELSGLPVSRLEEEVRRMGSANWEREVDQQLRRAA